MRHSPQRAAHVHVALDVNLFSCSMSSAVASKPSAHMGLRPPLCAEPTHEGLRHVMTQAIWLFTLPRVARVILQNL
jgi:hypothetical protein